MTEIEAILNADAARRLAHDDERPPRFRYFQKGNGPMFSWTTERFEGIFASFVHLPVGSGSRSGKAVEWLMDEESIRPHTLRKDAKARALRLYEEWLAREEAR